MQLPALWTWLLRPPLRVPSGERTKTPWLWLPSEMWNVEPRSVELMREMEEFVEFELAVRMNG